ncbi:MAG: T9SS type A sorting domain-containing protein, partial [Bacteroidota bacterium]
SFDQIGFVEGAGNSTAINAYSYRVITSKSRYYRFKQVDFDGTYAYGPVRFVAESDVWGKEPVIYPNPTRGVVFIAQVSNDELIRLDMMDVSGKQLDALHGTRPSVEQQLQKRLAHLPKGIYTLRLRTRDGVYLKKVIKE